MAVSDQSFEERLRRIEKSRGGSGHAPVRPAPRGGSATTADGTGRAGTLRVMPVVLAGALGLGLFVAGLAVYTVREITALPVADAPLTWATADGSDTAE